MRRARTARDDTGTQGSPTLWRNSNFLKLWAGETVSFLGSEVSGFAIPVVAALSVGAQDEVGPTRSPAAEAHDRQYSERRGPVRCAD